jgi:cytochrome c556
LAQINANRQAFNGFAKVMQDTAITSIKAIDARNVDALLEAGGALDEACETCHTRFWYPKATAPPQ